MIRVEPPDPTVPIPVTKLPTVIELVLARAVAYPERSAIADQEGIWTYAELSRDVLRIAQNVAATVVRGDPVAIVGGKNRATLGALMGVMFAGSVAVPIDEDLPDSRVDQMLAASRAPLAIDASNGRLTRALNTKVLGVQVNKPGAGSRLLQPVPSSAPAYIFFTSGTSGLPRGVVGWHQALTHFCKWEAEAFAFGPEDRVAQLASFSFDAVLKDVFPTLLTGGTIVLPWSRPYYDPQRLLEWLEDERITIVQTVPSVVASWVAAGGRPSALMSLRLLCLAGEPLLGTLVESWRTAFPSCTAEVVNLYGPTEATILKSFHRVGARPPSGVQSIGRPISETQLLILNPDNALCAVGEIGEIVIRTPFLTQGYLEASPDEAARFEANPFRLDPSDRVYRTGDLGRYENDGSISIAGRMDDEVKILGVRVQPAEVAAALGLHPSVISCAVLPDRSAGVQHLHAYYVGNAEPAVLRTFLADQLPAAMVPSSFSRVESIPLNANGKLDREALRTAAMPALAPRSRPLTQTEELLRQMWSELLRTPIDPHRDFFEHGGHSLLVIRAISRIRQVFNVQLEIRAFFDDPSLQGIARRIDAKLGAGPTLASFVIDRAPRDTYLPLSFPQRGIWFQLQLGSTASAYNMCGLLRIEGQLGAATIGTALQVLVDRHEALRTSIHTVDDVPHQVVHAAASLAIEYLDLREHETVGHGERLAKQWLANLANVPLELERPPLARAGVATIGEHTHFVGLTVHHIVCDGWSWEILVHELTIVLEAALSGRAPVLPPLALGYVDHAWRHSTLSDKAFSLLIDEWRHHLGTPIPALQLPTDFDQPERLSFDGAAYTFVLPAHVSNAFRALCRSEGATMYMGLFAAFVLLLGRLGGVEDMVVGTDTAGRGDGFFDDVVGLFADLQPVRISLAGDPSFAELLGRVRAAALGAYVRQNIPFERLIAALQPERLPNRTPLFQNMFRMAAPQPAPWRGRVHLDAQRLAEADRTAKFELTLSIEGDSNDVIGRFEYRTNLYSARRVEVMAEQYVSLVQQAAAEPKKSISTYLLQSRQARLPDPREPIVEPIHIPVTEQFRQIAARAPDRAAVRADGRTTSYSQLLAKCDAVAATLLNERRGLGRESVVAIVGGKDVASVARLCGVLQAGMVALPIDSSLPVARQEQLARAAGTQLILGPCAIDIGVEHVINDETPTTRGILSAPSLDSPAYIFFTSGSTGAPKGVLGQHKGIAHFVNWEMREFGISAEDRVAQITTFSFDAVLRDLFVPLVCGGTICLPTEEIVRDPGHITCWLDRERVNILHTTPSVFAALIAARVEAKLTSLRVVCLAGEPLLGEVVRRWRAAFPLSRAEIVNFYGPTETTMIKSFHRVGSAPRSGVQPIGRPLPQTQLLVLGPKDRECGVGELGELTVRTPFAMIGYIGGTSNEDSRFTANPFREDPQDRWYRTGDLGRYEPDGTITIAGRLDDEVKIRGVRVQPAEIAAVLSSHYSVDSCVVLPERSSGECQLTAYVVTDAEPSTLRAYLAERLPAPMLPSSFIRVERIPLTSNGKLDRDALRAIVPMASPIALTPWTGAEQQVAQIWREILDHNRFGLEDNFFDVGGHSLLATLLVSRLRRDLGVSVPLSAVLRSPTVKSIAQYVLRGGSGVPIGRSIELRPGNLCTYWVHPAGGDIACYRDLAAALPAGLGLRAFQAPGIDLGTSPVDDPDLLADMYLRDVNENAASGAVLCGWSIGGLLAYEMTKRALDAGRTVWRLVLVDTYAPDEGIWPDPDDGAIQQAFTEDVSSLGYRVIGALNPPDLERLARVFRAQVSAASRIRPRSIDVPITLFVARDQPRRRQLDRALGWTTLAARGIEIVELPGDHYSILRPPAVQILANELLPRLPSKV